MSKTELLTSVSRLEAYLKDRELNLPPELFEASDDVSLAQESLEGYNKQLEAFAAEDEKLKEAERKRIAESSKLLDNLLDEIRSITENLDDKFKKLHPNHKARFLELNKQLKSIVR